MPDKHHKITSIPNITLPRVHGPVTRIFSERFEIQVGGGGGADLSIGQIWLLKSVDRNLIIA